MRISDWSSDVCSSDLVLVELVRQVEAQRLEASAHAHRLAEALAAREQLQLQLQQQARHADQLHRELEDRLAAAHAAVEARDGEIESLVTAQDRKSVV